MFEEDIQKIIKTTFNQETLEIINTNMENLFNLLVRIIFKYEAQLEKKKNSGQKLNKQENDERKKNAKIIQRILNYLDSLASSNSAILLIIVEFFAKSYDILTRHNCCEISISPDFNNITVNLRKQSSDSKNITNSNKKNSKNKTEPAVAEEPERKCTCNFLTMLIRIWNKELDIDYEKPEKDFKVDKVFVTFLKSYKFKFLYSFSYYSLIDCIMKNKSEHIKTLSVQIFTIENIAEKLLAEEKLILNFFESLKEITEEYIKADEEGLSDGDSDDSQEKLAELFNICFEFYLQTYYVLKPKPAKVLSKNFYCLKIIIDIIALIQNSNKVKIVTSFQREAYDENYLYIEIYLLQMFSLIISNMDYSDINLTNDLVFYLIDKIIFEDHKIKLSDKEFSFHIALNRALGMLINRICIDYQVNKFLDYNEALRQLIYGYYNSLSFDERKYAESENNYNLSLNNFSMKNSSEIINTTSNSNPEASCDFDINNVIYEDTCTLNKVKSFNKEKKIFEISEEIHKIKYSKVLDFDEVLKRIMKNTIKFISFLNSIACDKWVYYGENMSFYYTLYFIFEVFSLSDYTLLKNILSLDKQGKIFSFQYFLTETNFNESYKEFLTNSFNSENITNKAFIKEKISKLKTFNTKNFNLLLKNLEYFLMLFISENNNNAFIRLFSFSLQKYMNNKKEDSVFEGLIKKESLESLKRSLGFNLIHIIFSKENSIYFSEIMKNLPFHLKKIFSEDEIDCVLNEVAEFFQLKNKPQTFKLKPDLFKKVDLFSYIDPQAHSTAEKHYLEFTKDKFAIINSPENEIFEYIKNFEKKFYENFFTANFFDPGKKMRVNFEFIYNYLFTLIANYSTLDLSDSFIFIFMKFFCLFLNFYKKHEIASLIEYNNSLFQNIHFEENMGYFKEKILSHDLINLLNENSQSKIPFAHSCKYLSDKIHEISPDVKNKITFKEPSALKNPAKCQAERGKKAQELLKQKFLNKTQNAIKIHDPNLDNANTNNSNNNEKDSIQNSNSTKLLNQAQTNFIITSNISDKKLEINPININDINLNLNEDNNYFSNTDQQDQEFDSNNNKEYRNYNTNNSGNEYENTNPYANCKTQEKNKQITDSNAVIQNMQNNKASSNSSSNNNLNKQASNSSKSLNPKVINPYSSSTTRNSNNNKIDNNTIALNPENISNNNSINNNDIINSNNSININNITGIGSNASIPIKDNFLSKKKSEVLHECIVCRCQLDKSDIYSNPFGKIGILNCSSFVYNSKLQTIKQEFERVIFKNKFNDFQTTSIINNLKSNILSSNINNNIKSINNNANNNNNNNANKIFQSQINLGENSNVFSSDSNILLSGIINNYNNNGNNNSNNINNNQDLLKKDSQLIFSQINNQTFIMNYDENMLLKDIMINYKKSVKEHKKSLRFTTCGHFVHISCHLKSMHNYISDQFKKLWFSCPLCKSMSNCIFPELDLKVPYLNPESGQLEDINDGITFAEIFNFLNDKKEHETNVEYLNTHLTIKDVFGNFCIPENISLACEDFIEKIISSTHNKFIISDFNIKNKFVHNSAYNSNSANTSCKANNSLNSNNSKNSTKTNSIFSDNFKNNSTSNNTNNINTEYKANFAYDESIITNLALCAKQEKYYETLKNFFINSLSLLDILREEDYLKTLNIIKIFILSLRMLIKSGSLEFAIFLNRFWNLFYFFKSDFYRTDNIVNFVDNDQITNNFFELLMLIMAFSNTSEFAYFKIIFKHYIPFFLLQFLIKEFFANFNFKTSLENFEKNFQVDDLLFMLNSPQYSAEIKKHCNFYLRKLTILTKIHEENFKEIFIDSFASSEEEFLYYTQELGFKPGFDIQDFLKNEKEFYPAFWRAYFNPIELMIDLITNYHNYKFKQLVELNEMETDGINIAYQSNIKLFFNSEKFYFLFIWSNFKYLISISNIKSLF